MRMSKLGILAAYVAIVVSGALVQAAAKEKTTPVEKVGKNKVQYVYVESNEGMEVATFRAFIVDGIRYAVPSRKLGYDPVFSLPTWIKNKSGYITSFKYWQYDYKGKKRVVTRSFPRYELISNGPWEKSVPGDVVEDPPK